MQAKACTSRGIWRWIESDDSILQEGKLTFTGIRSFVLVASEPGNAGAVAGRVLLPVQLQFDIMNQHNIATISGVLSRRFV
jgi:hypothetical protein